MMKNNVLIIGGSGGIGKEIINMLIAENMHVINIDCVSLDAFVQSNNYTEVLVTLTSNNSNEIVNRVINEYKEIDAFISTIGYYGIDTLDDFSNKKYIDTLEVNIDIPTQFSIIVSKLMKKQGFGKMIFVSSAAAYVGSRDIPYSISKAAILGLVRGLSKNLAGTNVYTYGVAPGIVETEMSERMNSERKNDAIKGTFNKRMCKPIEIAKLVMFLLLEDSGYMNGAVLHINNGLYLN